MARKAHHGGSWKVAYADFTTAMMALFLVLWLTSQDSNIKEAVERAFRNPFASVTKESVGIIPNQENHAVRDLSGNFDSASAVELNMLRRLNEDLHKSLHTDLDDPEAPSVELELTSDGLRITIFDRSQRPIFELQSTRFTPYGHWVFSTLAWELARYRSFTIDLEGHTEFGWAPLQPDYGDWEISADRANAARRKLLEHGVERKRIRKVAGFADTQPMPKLPVDSETNRRVSVLLSLNSDAS
jgi:chemotaxis protein MotB